MITCCCPVLVRISGEEFALSLRDRFHAWAGTPIAPRRPAAAAAGEKEAAAGGLQLRHAGVLGA